MPAYIQGRNVNLTFRPPNRGPVRALHGFDIEVREGEFLSIVGPSGCGKSTFLNVLLGLIKPDSGDLTLDGKRISGPGTDRAMVFQEFGLLPWRTVQHNVELGLELKGMAAETRREISARFIEMVGLVGFEGHYPHELSGGMKQRVGLARALATDPDVLLMDEPFAALDAQTRDIMQVELLRIWQEARKTVLFVTHQIDEAIYLSDRVMVMTKRPGRAKKMFRDRAAAAARLRDAGDAGIQRSQARDLARAQGRDHGLADDGRCRSTAELRRAPPQGAARLSRGRAVLRRLAGGVPGRAVQSAVHQQAEPDRRELRRFAGERRPVARSRHQRGAVPLWLHRRGGGRRDGRHRHGLARAGRLRARSADDRVLCEPAGRAGAAGDRLLRRRRLRARRSSSSCSRCFRSSSTPMRACARSTGC